MEAIDLAEEGFSAKFIRLEVISSLKLSLFIFGLLKLVKLPVGSNDFLLFDLAVASFGSFMEL